MTISFLFVAIAVITTEFTCINASQAGVSAGEVRKVNAIINEHMQLHHDQQESEQAPAPHDPVPKKIATEVTIPMIGKGRHFYNSPKLVTKSGKFEIEVQTEKTIGKPTKYDLEELAVFDIRVTLPDSHKKMRTRKPIVTNGVAIFALASHDTWKDKAWQKVTKWWPFSRSEQKFSRHLLVAAVPEDSYKYAAFTKQLDVLKKFVKSNLGRASVEFHPKVEGADWEHIDQWKLHHIKGKLALSQIDTLDIKTEDLISMIHDSLTVMTDKKSDKLGKYFLIGTSVLDLQEQIGTLVSQMISVGVETIIRDLPLNNLDFLK